MRASELSLEVVFDNYAYRRGLRTSWGFACIVRGAGASILFDTGGDGAVLLGNMGNLSIDPRHVDAVVLSHAHADHTGGLGAFIDLNPDVTVFMPRSFPDGFASDVAARGAGVVEVGEPIEIRDSVFSTGEMGTSIVEQSLVLRTDGGLVIVTGCAHPGIVEIVERTRIRFDRDDVLLVTGGFHTRAEPRPERIVSRFRELGVRHVGPSHCSGERTRACFARQYGPGYVEIGVGASISLGDLASAT
jgi:7,8-dihydropterin-6-yl-methyl-4-(beta-D-ribofuranosyl)aminobenzene 5'-phosphate synthase